MIPPERLGRVMGLVMTISTGMQPLAYGAAGAATGLLSVPTLAIFCGVGIAVGALYLLVVPGFRDI